MLSAAGATIGYDPHGPDVVMAAEFDRVTAERDALQQDLNQRDEQIATLDLQREAHLRNSQVTERRVGVLDGLLRRCQPHLPRYATALRTELHAALKPAEGSNTTTCTWSSLEFSWQSSCGMDGWEFTDGGTPAENGMHFCHSCGNRLLVEVKGDE
jgi:hypothetical protein